jgi:hypothetical protein
MHGSRADHCKHSQEQYAQWTLPKLISAYQHEGSSKLVVVQVGSHVRGRCLTVKVTSRIRSSGSLALQEQHNNTQAYAVGAHRTRSGQYPCGDQPPYRSAVVRVL